VKKVTSQGKGTSNGPDGGGERVAGIGRKTPAKTGQGNGPVKGNSAAATQRGKVEAPAQHWPGRKNSRRFGGKRNEKPGGGRKVIMPSEKRNKTGRGARV